ncbi:chondroitinase-B domain-containing protein [Polaribacter sp. Hel1_85]|uniref:chondroitinase-B domain-containing protein n=1 Tax=Polaribacter sp. Hel1_85 TaxID=1250005 RepID=UPI00052D6E26|nr:chondroitinase-B domain-containing protein [Polaribacter sp. Hel1_85]KGL62746.1 polysaccharide lyase, BACON domain protein, PL6-2 family [Polaribacter sp. Hel1_85]
MVNQSGYPNIFYEKTAILPKKSKKLNFSKAQFLFTFIILLTIQAELYTQTLYTSDTDLRNAVNAATEGGTFIVKNGSYDDFSGTFEIMATEENPIIIKAETVGAVTLTGGSGFVFRKSAYITLEGFIFDGEDKSTIIKFEGSNNIRITRNVFNLKTDDDSTAKWIYIGGYWDDKSYPFQWPSHNNRIDHNIFQNKSRPGHYITVDGNEDEDTEIFYQSQYDRIDHNYFKNNSPRAVNEQESIRVGWSEMSQSSGYTTVEYNLFEDCDGDPEIVSVKSSDNIIRHNTFLKSYGTLSLRHGDRNRVEGNYFFGGDKPISTSPDGATLYTGGIRIYGKDHVIINNYMQGLNGTRWDAPITLTMGDAVEGNSDLSAHFIAKNVLIAYNTLVDNSHGIEIGFSNNGKYSKDLENITIANNLITGSENALVAIKDGNDQGTDITWKNNLFNPTGSATTIVDATTTSFTESMVKDENPFLVSESYNDYTVWRTSASSPTYANAVTSETITIDIEGQTRPTNSNPGADHFSTESERFMPLQPADVGPNAYETDDSSESLYISTITSFGVPEETQTVTVTANVDWSVTDDRDWVTVTPSSGSNNGSFDITVTANIEFTERTGKVTITGGDLTRLLNITQAAADPRSTFTLINDDTATDNVTVASVFHEEIDPDNDKNNVAIHSLDKDFDTQWSGNGVPGEIVYNLGGTFDLALVDFATTSGKTYEFQIWVSTTDTAEASFSNAFPNEGNTDGNLTSNSTGEFKAFILPTVISAVKYVKIIGYGQPARPSDWNTIKEIEFYKTKTLSVDNVQQLNTLVYPNPTNNTLHLSNINDNVTSVKVISLNGKVITTQKIKTSQKELTIDTSRFANGLYIVHILSPKQEKQSKKIIIQH